MIHVAAKFDPFKAGPDRAFLADPGATIAELVERCQPPEWFDLVGHVAIKTPTGIAPVARDKWERVRPKAGTLVAIYCLPMGGGRKAGGKDPLTTVATIAVLAAATAVSGGLLGPAAAGTIGTGLLGGAFAAGGIGAALAGAAVGIAGSLAISALAPPPIAANLKDANRDTPSLTSAGVTGNAIARGAQVPTIAGTIVASPPYVARPYTSFSNGDTYSHAIVGLWGQHNVVNIKINGTDYTLIPDLQIEVMKGASVTQSVRAASKDPNADLTVAQVSTDPKVTVAPDTVIEDRTIGQLSEFQSADASDAAIWHYATTDGPADKIIIRIVFPSGLLQGSTVIGVPLHVAMRKVGDTDWINFPEIHYSDRTASTQSKTQQIVIDWLSRTPNGASTSNASYYTYSALSVAGDWTPHSYFQSTPTDPTPVNTSLDRDGVTFHLADSSFPRGEYEIRIMRGLAYEKASFTPTTYLYGSTAANFFGPVFNNTVGAFISQDGKVSLMMAEVVQTWREDYPLNSTEPMTLIAIKGRRLQLESISAQFTSYAPIWTGTAWSTTPLPTSNPAAIYRRMLIDYNYVTGRLPDSMRDDDGLAAWYNHCVAKGYSINAVIDGGTLQEGLQMVAAAGWALPLYGQKWGVIIEKDRSAESPVQMLTPLTGRGLQWEKTFDTLPHAIAAEFLDASREYKQRDDVFIYRTGYNALNATNYETINYKGIVSEAQAVARAKLDLGQVLYRRTSYKLDIWIEHLMARRGDLVLLSHDTLGKRYGFARVLSVTKSGANITGVVLDQGIEIPAGAADLFSVSSLFSIGVTNDLFQNYTAVSASIRHSTGSAITYPVSNPAGGATLAFETPFADPGTILPGCVVAVGARGMAARRCLVFDVTRNDLETATVTLVDEAPEIYTL